jgi:hypothetical protein
LLLRLFEDFSEVELPLGELSLEAECDDECSESPLGELSLEAECDDECSLFIGAPTTGAGATTTGAG